MASSLRWETIQRNYSKATFNGRIQDACYKDSKGELESENVPAVTGISSYIGNESPRFTRNDSSSTRSYSPPSSMLKTKISRAPIGNYYAVFSPEKGNEHYPSVVKDSKSTHLVLPARSPGEKVGKLDYDLTSSAVGSSCTQVRQPAEESLSCNGYFFSTKAKAGTRDAVEGLNIAFNASRNERMEKVRDCEDKKGIPLTNNVALAENPGQRHQSSGKPLNYSSARVYSRRHLVKSEGNLDDKCNLSTSLEDITQGRKLGEEVEGLSNGNKRPRRLNVMVKHAGNLESEASREKKESVIGKDEQISQPNHFSKMLQQFKQKESEREKRKEQQKSTGAVPQFQAQEDKCAAREDKCPAVSDNPCAKLTRVASDHSSVSSVPDDSGSKPRFPRRKSSYMDSWLQSQQSRITNLVETAKGEHSTHEPSLPRSQTFDFGFSESYSDFDEQKTKANLRKLSSFDSDGSRDSFRSKRTDFKHSKSSSLDISFRDANSDEDMPVEPHPASQTRTSAVFGKEMTVMDPILDEGARKGKETLVSRSFATTDHVHAREGRGAILKEHVTHHGTGAAANCHGQPGDLSSYSIPLVQKYTKKGHPLAVVKPFHLGMERESLCGDQVVKTDRLFARDEVSTGSTTLETDLDLVMAECAPKEGASRPQRADASPAGEDQPSASSLIRKGSITRVAIVTIQRRHVVGGVEGKSHAGVGDSPDDVPKLEPERPKESKLPASQTSAEQFGHTNTAVKHEELRISQISHKTESQRIEGARSQNAGMQFSGRQPDSDRHVENERASLSSEAETCILKNNVSSPNCPARVEDSGEVLTHTLYDKRCVIDPYSREEVPEKARKHSSEGTLPVAENELTELNNERLEYLNEALMPDEEEYQADSRSIASCRDLADRISCQDFPHTYSDAISVSSDAFVREEPHGQYKHFRSRSADVARDFDRMSLASYSNRSGSVIGEAAEVQRQGHSYPGSAHESGSGSESSDDEENLKTMSERIRPWDPEARRVSVDASGPQRPAPEQDADAPRVIRRQGKGAVDRINKSLSIVMGELKELRKQDVDLAKQLLTLGKSIKEFKRHKREMEEEMLADYLFELESDQFSLSDGLSLSSYDVEYVPK